MSLAGLGEVAGGESAIRPTTVRLIRSAASMIRPMEAESTSGSDEPGRRIRRSISWAFPRTTVRAFSRRWIDSSGWGLLDRDRSRGSCCTDDSSPKRRSGAEALQYASEVPSLPRGSEGVRPMHRSLPGSHQTVSNGPGRHLARPARMGACQRRDERAPVAGVCGPPSSRMQAGKRPAGIAPARRPGASSPPATPDSHLSSPTATVLRLSSAPRRIGSHTFVPAGSGASDGPVALLVEPVVVLFQRAIVGLAGKARGVTGSGWQAVWAGASRRWGW